MIYTLADIKSESPYCSEVILYFKVNPCQIPSHKSLPNEILLKHVDRSLCYFYHTLEERRRRVFDSNDFFPAYEPTLCSFFQKFGRCHNGDHCTYSHTQNEVNYHPLVYKTIPCADCQFESAPNQCHSYHPDEGVRTFFSKRIQNKKKRDGLSPDFLAQKNFNLETFKTKQCTSKGNHNPKVCPFFHKAEDRRRVTPFSNYKWELCPVKFKNCIKGDNCEYSHNLVEQLYHPDRYKKKFCSFHPHKVQDCPYGIYCSFAHSESEIRIELLHNMRKDEQFYLYKYKTIMCPYTSGHNRSECLYAHNPQDFRRDPQHYKYHPVQCQYWTEEPITSYNKGNCPKLMQCENTHGWKELDYHPAVYKTKTCLSGAKCLRLDCPNIHLEKMLKDAITLAEFEPSVPSNQSGIEKSDAIVGKIHNMNKSGKNNVFLFESKDPRGSEVLTLEEKEARSKGLRRENILAASKTQQGEIILGDKPKSKNRIRYQPNVSKTSRKNYGLLFENKLQKSSVAAQIFGLIEDRYPLIEKESLTDWTQEEHS